MADRMEPPFSPPDCPWVDMTSGSAIPENAFECGKLKGDTVYIGRVFDENCYLVGTAIPSKDTCIYLSKNGEIKSTSVYSLLTGGYMDVLAFEPMALDSRLLFITGGDSENLLYCTRVVDGENTYIGWADKDIRTVYIPRELEAGPNKLTENYEILIHKLLDRLCVCPRPPNPPPF